MAFIRQNFLFFLKLHYIQFEIHTKKTVEHAISRQNLAYCTCLFHVRPLEVVEWALRKFSVFNQCLFMLHSKENFE